MRESWGPPCKPDLVTMAIYSGGPRFQCEKRAREAFTQLGAVFLRHGYIIRTCGSYNCRPNTSDPSKYSNHSWGTALDVNESTNPYRHDKLVTDMSREMINEILTIQTADGVQVFRCGADWDGNALTAQGSYDAMHFEIVATPAELEAGFTAHPGDAVRAVTWPVIRRGATGPAVLELQRLLGMERVTGAGTFGPRTEIAVILYQRSRGLAPDGIIGHGTWTALLTNQPALQPGQSPPVKRAA